MTFGFIKAETASFPITRMCQVLDVSRSGFFPWQYRPACRRQQQDMIWTPALAGAVAALALPDAADPPFWPGGGAFLTAEWLVSTSWRLETTASASKQASLQQPERRRRAPMP